MLAWFHRRYLELVASIYIYNEYRGYTAIDRVLAALRTAAPGDAALLAAVEKHRADERKHYRMFRRWFEDRGVMPFALDRAFGHIDRFVEIIFRSTLDDLDASAVVASDERFARLCRVIALTERRGYRQVEILLRNPLVRTDRVLGKIFRIIEQDEADHWMPYEDWLARHDICRTRWWERVIDGFIHSELLLVKLPLLFVTPWVRRRTDWADACEGQSPGTPALAAG
jgi:hypothetical protein